MSFKKVARPHSIISEVMSLRWLGEATDHGGAPVAHVEEYGETFLVTTTLQDGSPTREQAREFGRALARTHAEGAEWWGQAPPGVDASQGSLATAALPLVAEPTWESFGEFYAEARLQPYFDSSAWPAVDLKHVTKAIDLIASGSFDSPQPELVRSVAARVHGDLWGGNVMWPKGVGTLIDPCAHGGHAESDLAQLTVFGAPHIEEIYAGYCDESPLAEGWERRIPVHQFHMLLVHVHLFGGSYVGRTAAVAQDICDAL